MTTTVTLFRIDRSAALLALLFSCLSAFPTEAADQATLTAARQCATLQPQGEGGKARGDWHRRLVECLKALYIEISAPGANAAVTEELRARLDALEQTYYDSRAICSLLQRECGTISLSPAEFRTLLKTMIVNEDAGWTRADPRLEEALDLTGKGSR